MKYTIFFTFIFSLYFIKTCAQSGNSKIKTIKEISYLLENNQIKSRKDLFKNNPDYITHYDKTGKIIETRYYNKNGELIIKLLHERNEKGEDLKIVKFNSSNELKSYSIIKYNIDKTINEILTYDKEDKLIEIVYSKSNKEKNVVETIIKDSLNDVGWKIIYNYNDENKLREEIHYKPNGKVIKKKTYNYLDNRYKTLQYNYKSNESFNINISEYDEKNNLIFQEWIDEKGEITSYASFEYINDDNGNWITQKKIFNNETVLITEKEIIYWE